MLPLAPTGARWLEAIECVSVGDLLVRAWDVVTIQPGGAWVGSPAGAPIYTRLTKEGGLGYPQIIHFARPLRASRI